ncbi:MAG: hypothetical protein JSW12_06675 [Deltaproteobacteria bacterium]|nr:MAG: hypothetical protein JSW12_06675 [Deltaproteobacteria bacterium]
MGTGLRIFPVNDDDSIQRLSVARCERLLRGDPRESLPQNAGRRVRYALVALDLVNRKPVDVTHLEYGILCFDSKGHIDATEQEKEWRLGAKLMSPLLIENHPRQVIDAGHRFARKRYDDRYRWTPTEEIVAAIVKAIFGRGSK